MDARQRAARGGFAVHRIAPAPEAAAESARLRAAGLLVLEVAEAEVAPRAQPVVARRGAMEGAALRLETGQGTLRLAPGEVMLVVRGPIAREYPPAAEARRVRLAGLEPGYRFHLHRNGVPAPVELDPGGLEFGARPAGDSSLLRLNAWVQAVAGGALQDDGFRFVTPALAPAAPEDAGPAAAADALAGRAGRETTPVLDNLAQFRAYSAWRAAVEARRAG